MIYFGISSTPAVLEAMRAGLLGVMSTPNSSYDIGGTYLGVQWAADNGCFSGAWTEPVWRSWLTRNAEWRDRCAFAALPDVPYDADATRVEHRPGGP